MSPPHEAKRKYEWQVLTFSVWAELSALPHSIFCSLAYTKVGSIWPGNLWIASCGGDIYAISTRLSIEPLLKSAHSIAVEALVKERTDLTGHLLCLPEEHVHDLKCRWFGTVNWKGHAALLWRSDNTILDEMGQSQFQKLFFICQVVSRFDALKGTHHFGRKLTIGHVGPSCAVKNGSTVQKGHWNRVTRKPIMF